MLPSYQIVILWVVSALLTSPAAASDQADGMAIYLQRCAMGSATAADDGINWDVLCQVGGQIMSNGGPATLPEAPPWAAATTDTFASLWPTVPTEGVEFTAWDRQRKTLESGVEVVQATVEPWLDDPNAATVCGATLDLYLYARILDDAIDEGEPVHRQQALLAQPLLWRSCAALSQLHPERTGAAEAIVHEVVGANTPRAPGDAVPYWGAKNHHLLLGALSLAPSTAAYQAVADELALGMWGMQANGEFAQTITPADVAAMRRFLAAHDHAAAIQTLHEGGWRWLAGVYFVAVVRAVAMTQ